MVIEHIKAGVPKFSKLNLTIALIALCVTVIAAGIGTWLDLRSAKTEVTAQVLACDELTTYHPELEAKFTYAGEEVAHLWKLTVKFVNSGDKTIVGIGNQSNILGTGLNFVFPDYTRILRYEYGENAFEGSIILTNLNEFQIQFSQWRSGEYMTGSFYVASEQPLTVAPCPAAPSRNIIDGDIVVQGSAGARSSEQMPLIDRLPRAISILGKIIGVILAGLLTLLAISLSVGIFWSWQTSLRFERWKKRYLTSFSEYLDQIKPPLSDKEKRKYKDDPYTLPKRLWADFKGKAAPVKGDMTEVTFTSSILNIGFSIASLLVAFGFVSIILALIPV